MIKIQSLFNFSRKDIQPSVEEQKRLELDQAIQLFASRIDSSLNTVSSIKNFIYPDYTTSHLFHFENREIMHGTVETFLKARASYLAAVTSWAQRKLPDGTLGEHVEFARDSLRQIDPRLVGEKRYEKTDHHVVRFAKWAFYALSRTFTADEKIEKRTRRLDVLERRHSLEQDRVTALELFEQEMQEFLPVQAPSTLPEIASYFQNQYVNLSPRELMEVRTEFTAFQQAKKSYFKKLTQLDHTLDEIFGRSPLRRAIEEVTETEAEDTDDEVEQPIEHADRTIYKGSLIQPHVRKTVIDALTSAGGDRETAEFVARHLVPTGIKEFVLYKNEKKCEIHFDNPKEGTNSKSETKDRKYLVDQKLVVTFNEGGKIEFENGGYRIGVVSKDLECHLEKAPRLLRSSAKAALGDYLEKGLKLSLDLTGITLTKEGIRLHISPITGDREVPMEGGLVPSGVIGSLIQRFTSHDDVPFEEMEKSYTHFVWK
ncbi:hypothetical protein [Simkania sp.]|uniref:hypothetical protein n=1 Tax=Simkania sp. TaxID=34094 RepID=UPI003B518F6E